MDIHLFETLHEKGLISETSLGKVTVSEKNKLFSLHWELRSILYLGVLLLSGDWACWYIKILTVLAIPLS